MRYPHIDPSETEKYYKFFTRVNGEKRYYSSFLSTFEGSVYDLAKGYPVNRGIHDTFTGDNKFTPLYTSGDTARVKLGGNMFFTVSQDCPSNIPGAKGYWAGYGTSLA